MAIMHFETVNKTRTHEKESMAIRTAIGPRGFFSSQALFEVTF